MKKILISFGFVWIVIWCLVGLYNGAIHTAYADRMLEFAQKGDLYHYWTSWKAWKWRAIVHSHAISFSFLVLFVGMVFDQIKLKEKTKVISGICMMAGVVMAGVFGTLEMLIPDAIGDLLLLGGFIVCTVGYLKGLQRPGINPL